MPFDFVLFFSVVQKRSMQSNITRNCTKRTKNVLSMNTLMFARRNVV